MVVLYKRTLRHSDLSLHIHNMTARRPIRFSARLSDGKSVMAHEVQPEKKRPDFATDSLTNGVGTVRAVQKRRLLTTLEPTPSSSTKSKRSKKPEKRSEQEMEDGLFAVHNVPKSLNKRQKQASAIAPVAPPLSTPTPSPGKPITSNDPNPATPEKASPSHRRRKVEPHATNAPLQTPGGGRITTYPSQVFESGSQTPSQQTDTLTTDNALEKACAHLISVDPRLKTVIAQHHCRMFSPEGLAEEVEPFVALASGIIGQQVRPKRNLTFQPGCTLINDPWLGVRRGSRIH